MKAIKLIEKKLEIIVKTLNSLSIKSMLLLMFFYYFTSGAAATSPYGFNPTALIHFGNFYIEQNENLTPVNAVRFQGNEQYGGNGYDGQIFYYYARSLFMLGTWPDGFNNAYRAPRIGYPFLAGIFSFMGSWGTVFGMIFIQIILLLLSLAALIKILPDDKRYLALFYIFSPFSLQSFVLLVSDSVMVSLVIIGYYFYLKMEDAFSKISFNETAAFIFFSLAVLTKESSLFFLFPLGLYALVKKDKKRILLMVLILLPMILWQLYLRHSHGMLPAGVLKIFLSPFNGIFYLALTTYDMTGDFFRNPGLSSLMVLMKHSIKWFLFLLIIFSCGVFFSGGIKKLLPLRLGVLITLISVVMADYYYFWGIYENISRMFTVLVPLMILVKGEEGKKRFNLFFGILSLLSLLVFLRIIFLTPAYPYDSYRPYEGKFYGDHAPVPGIR